MSAPRLFSQRNLVITLFGLVVGGLFAAWSLKSRGAEGGRVPVPDARVPAAPVCPLGHFAVPGYDVRAVLGPSALRWVVRCDPERAGYALSEPYEILWTPQILLDPRLREDLLRTAVQELGASARLVLRELPRPTALTLDGVPGHALDADGVFVLPGLTVQSWVLPVGRHSLEVRLIVPTARASEGIARVASHLASIQGLAPATPGPVDPARGFRVSVQCPPGFEDRTPPGGGDAPAAFLGRYCLRAGEDGGEELSFTEITSPAVTDASYAAFFALAAQSIRAVGAGPEATFGAPSPVTVGGVTGRTASLVLAPPPAELRVRAVLFPSSDATVVGLAVSMREQAGETAGNLTAWMHATGLVRNVDPGVVRDRYRTKVVSTIVAAALLSALLAFVGAQLFRGPRLLD